jgi:MFS superfamily sulfate permease-like transporter
MKKWIPKILAIIVMIPVFFIGITVGIIWNVYLLLNSMSFSFKRKWVAGIKEVKKTPPRTQK